MLEQLGVAPDAPLREMRERYAGVFRFTVRRDLKLCWPRAETPTHVITMGPR